MKKKQDDYQVVPFPQMRNAVIDHLHQAQRKHMIHALTEVDVTKARQIIREHKTRTGESLSFTAFIITCLGRAVDKAKTMHAYRKGRNQLVLFDDGRYSTGVRSPDICIHLWLAERSPHVRVESHGHQSARHLHR